LDAGFVTSAVRDTPTPQPSAGSSAAGGQPDRRERALAAERDALAAERDALAAERDALAEEARRLRTVVDMLPVGLWFTDASGRIVFANPAAQRIWAGARYVPPEQFHEYKGWWEATGERIAAGEWALLRAVLRGETTLEERVVIECFDGTRKTILNSAFPVLGADGRITGGVVVNEDVTARRRAEREREEALEHLAFHVDHSPIGVVDWSADFRVTAWNPAAERIFGWTAAEVLGKRSTELRWVHEDDAEKVAAVTRELTSGARTRTVSVNRNVRKDGTLVWCEWYSSARLDAAGRLVSARSQVVDVTARVRAEQALREESRRKDTFIATLGHELRNPLTPIRAGFELLRREGVEAAQREAAAAVVDRQLRHLSRLVDDLLDVSRVSRGKVELRPRPLDLGRLVRDALADHRALFSRGGIVVEEQLPDAAVPAFGDPVRLAQALGNVLQNAAKFTPPGGRVRVSVEARERRAEVRVTDTGDGITAGTLARIFQPFEQGERPGRAGGLGLGLALALGLVLALGGELTARSDGSGLGAEFVLALPITDAAEAVLAPTPAPVRPGRKRVLLVEDNEDAGEMLRELLLLDGHEVALARDGTEGLAQARTFHPDVVVSDLGLPGELDGYGLARALRAEVGDGLRIVALSGFAAPDDVARSHAAGFDAHFAKPLELERLKPLLEG
jgi:PAS domain S-box-containing protein